MRRRSELAKTPRYNDRCNGPGHDVTPIDELLRRSLGRAQVTLTQGLPATWPPGDAGVTRSTSDLLAANSNDPALADTGEDDAIALAQQLRDQVFQLHVAQVAD